ncbi:hypothetical protein KR074_005222, partial [Drosophila pseudoananassae]
QDQWVYMNRSLEFPKNAVLGGMDPNGYYNYVGRWTNSESILPARVVSELGKATFNTLTDNYVTYFFDVLVSNETVSYHWKRSFDGFREENAVSVGTDSVHYPVYICRAYSDSSVIIGTLLLARGSCVIKYESLPIRYHDKYEILQVWVAGNLSYVIPSNALVGGYDPNGYNTYVGRVKAGNDILPARIVVETGIAYYNTETVSGKLLIYDFLVAERNVNYVWQRSYDGFYEKNSVAAGTTVKNERVYFCRSKTDGGLLIGTLLLPQKVCIIKHESLSLRKLDKYEVLVAQ